MSIRVKSFLDTSVLMLREFGTELQKTKVSDALEGTLKHTTSYAKMEINCTIIKDAIFLRSLMVDEYDLRKVFQRLQTYPFTERERKRCLTLLSKVTNRQRLSLVEAILRLENLIYTLHSILLREVIMVASGTACPLADIAIELIMTYKNALSCTRDGPACEIEEYLKHTTQKLRKLHNDILSITYLRSLCNLLVQVIDNPKIAKGRNCRILGDVIISLDAPDDQTIFSTNIEDFEPICSSLGRKFIGIRLT